MPGPPPSVSLPPLVDGVEPIVADAPVEVVAPGVREDALRHPEGIVDHVVPGASVEAVVPAAADQAIVPAPAVDDVRSVAPVDRVGQPRAEQDVVVRRSLDRLDPQEEVDAFTVRPMSRQIGVHRSASQEVRDRIAPGRRSAHRCRPCPPADLARFLRDRVVPAPAIRRSFPGPPSIVSPSAALDRVSVSPARQGVGAVATADPVVPSASDDHVVAAEAEDRVAAGVPRRTSGPGVPTIEPVRAKQSGAADAGALTVAIASAATAVTTPLRRPRPVSSRCMHPSGRPRRFDAPPPGIAGSRRRLDYGVRVRGSGAPIVSNGDIADLLWRASDEETTHRRRALRKASGAARFWSEEAADLVEAGRPHGAPSRRSLGGRTDPGVARRAARAPGAGCDEARLPDPRGGPGRARRRSRVGGNSARRPPVHTTDSDGSLRSARWRRPPRARPLLHRHHRSLEEPDDRERDERGAARGSDRPDRRAERGLATGGDGFRILRSMEMDVFIDGSADMEPGQLAPLDLVLGAFHSKLRLREDQTERYVKTLRNPSVHVLAPKADVRTSGRSGSRLAPCVRRGGAAGQGGRARRHPGPSRPRCRARACGGGRGRRVVLDRERCARRARARVPPVRHCDGRPGRIRGGGS